ncbi:hypothetical protein [Streptomyces sp. NBC_00620]|uniref:hypothetical protein n=1 Tax=Streptomyces sp. NBC_00620 TaxID=2903666 RepID=UPI0022597B95|nr:hypothetical protein [Streptomyces sp. NBC_00620]MCX4974233.1 hypothetical protein [Streptomyces sp. NBC_00620]
MALPLLTLFSSSLLSKWGFNDGSTPDDWLDYCEARHIDHTKVAFPLAPLVRRHLLPALEQQVTLVDMESSHNPIRALTVDGQDMTEVWHGREPEPTLTPEAVHVPMAIVLDLALTEASLTEAPHHAPPLSTISPGEQTSREW